MLVVHQEGISAAPSAPARRTGSRLPLVLIVEDDVGLNPILVSELGTKHQVVSVFDGGAGLARAIELVPDVIVADLRLPLLNGEQMIAAIRAIPALDSSGIIVLSANPEIMVRARLLREGVQDYVLKPFAIEELLARVENQIALKHMRDILRAEVASSRADVAELASDLAQRARHAQFVANATVALSRSLDYQITLAEVASLAVPDIADACAVDVADADGTMHRVATRSVSTPDERQLLGSAATVIPLEARNRRIGLLTLAWSDPERRYAPNELALAEQLAGSAALAIDNAQLYLEARTAIGLRDEFLSVASHELRTPLQPLVIAVHMLADTLARDTAEPEPRGKLISTVVRQVERLNGLVDELLSATRIEAEEMSLDREELELGELVERVLARFAQRLARSGCATSVCCCGRVVGQWDRMRLEQLVSNLVANAVKYAAGAPIEVTVARVDDRAQLSIRDHGIGIAPECQARIFERFGRAVSTRNYGGLGLGLYIGRRIAEAHGGSITVDSQLDAGAVFVVELPL